MLDARFSRRDDGVVDTHLPEEWRPLEDTSQDAVTTRAPRGSDGINPSTCWIDETLAAMEQGSIGTTVASGDATDLLLGASTLVAHSQHEMFDDQHVAAAELVDLLHRWRTVVLDLLGPDQDQSQV